MRYTTSLLALAPLALAAPVRRQNANIDVTILKFADVLEQFESQFYQAALQKFQSNDFTAAGFVSSDIPIQQFKTIQTDEATHSTVLQSVLKSLNEEPVTSCKFKFDDALSDVATMAATARVVENLGVSAYLGAAPLVTDPILLQAAGSILTVEARHQTVLNALSGTGTAIPNAFDVAFSPSEVLAVAAPFFDGPCDLGVPANPTLSITNTGAVTPGTLVTFKSDAINGTIPDDQLHCQMLIGGQPNSLSLKLSECKVPDGLDGPVAIFITSDDQPVVANSIDRINNNGKIIAGPTMAFIDTAPQMLGQMLRAGNGGTTETTSTISPDQASSILSGSSATATASGAEATGTAAPPPVNNGVNNGGKPVLSTGPSADGKIIVMGWTGL